MADPTRRAIIERLCRGPASVSTLADAHNMALPSFMQHLQVLEESGLVRSQKVGRVRTCECIREPLFEAEHWLGQQRMVWERRLDQWSAESAPADELLMTAIINIAAHQNGTKYTAIAIHGDSTTKAKHDSMGFHAGWGAALDQLVAHMKRQA